MTQQKENSKRYWHETRIALLLAGVGGSVDAIGYLMFSGLFMGFMSGNSTLLGLHVGQGHWANAGSFAFTIFLFTIGAFIGVLLSGKNMMPALIMEIIFLTIALLWQVWSDFKLAGADAAYLYPRVVLLAGAMGIQAGALRRVGTQSVHTTFVTGNLTSLAASFATPFLKSGKHSDTGQPAKQVMALAERKDLLGWVWVMYILGAVSGAFVFGRQARSALLLPILLLIIIIALTLLGSTDPQKEPE